MPSCTCADAAAADTPEASVVTMYGDFSPLIGKRRISALVTQTIRWEVLFHIHPSI